LATKYANKTKENLQDEFAQKFHYLVDKIGIKVKQIADALEIEDISNLTNYANREKPKSIGRDPILKLLKKLNRKFKPSLTDFVFQPKEYEHGPLKDGEAQSANGDLLANFDNLGITQEARFNVLVRRLAAAGVNLDNLDEEIEKEKDAIRAQKNNPQ
jgi:hypothetical protein